MERIICDSFEKGKVSQWTLDADSPSTQAFNRKIKAVNNMFAWLYEKGILDKIAFEMKDYVDVTYFALDAKDLAPYREEMVSSGLEDADLAVQHIFDEEYSPCMFSGAIELTWMMRTYRDFDGTVSRSWECDLCRHLNSSAVLDVEEVKESRGVKEAVKLAFELSGFMPCDVFRVRPLDESNMEQVAALDSLSGNCVADGLDSEEYAWGVFAGLELVGYCTLGGADDPDMGYIQLKEWNDASLVLSDVYVKEEWRGKGVGSLLINQALEKACPEKESVFLTVLDDRLAAFYRRLGFVEVEDGTMVRQDAPWLETLINAGARQVSEPARDAGMPEQER